MALVQLSVVEQRLDAVRAVLAGARVTEVAASLGVSPQSAELASATGAREDMLDLRAALSQMTNVAQEVLG